MKLLIKRTDQETYQWVAEYISQAILDFHPYPNNCFNIGLPLHCSEGLYKELIALHKKGTISFKYVKIWIPYEFVGVRNEQKISSHHFMYRNFFKYIDVNPKNVFIPNGNAEYFDCECCRFNNLLEEHGPIDLFVGALNQNGNIAYNEPFTALTSETRVVPLSIFSMELLGKTITETDCYETVPQEVITLGVENIMKSKQVLMIAIGCKNSLFLRRVVEEGINSLWTASFLQMHMNCIFACDENATRELQSKTVNYYTLSMNFNKT